MRRTQAKISSLMWQFGVAMFLFLLVIGVLSLAANMAPPVRLNLTVFFSALGAFLLYTVYWTLLFYRAFRLPQEKAGGANQRVHGAEYRCP